MQPTEVLAYFDERSDKIVDVIREMVDVESPSFDDGQSRKLVDLIQEKVREISLSVSVSRTEFDGIGTHLAITAFPGDQKPVLILGHTDTVHPLGSRARNATRIDGDKLFGCGVFDMKAGVALAIESLRYFAETGTSPNRPLTIFLSCDEEVGSSTGRALVEDFASLAECCLVIEPSAGGRVKTGRKGTGMFQVTANGVSSHAGLDPEKGANAIAELARQVKKIHSVGKPDIGTTVNVTTFHGGTATNVIPDAAVRDIDVRYLVSDEAARINAELKALKASDPRVSLTLTGGINRPPLERSADVVDLYEKARVIAAGMGYELGETQVGGGSDGNFVAAMGVPVLDGLGVTGDGAHTLDEYIVISDIPKRAALLTLLLASL